MPRPAVRHWALRSCLVVAAVAAVTPTARAQEFVLTDDRAGYPTAPILLLSREDVRRDLGLDTRQTAAAREAVATLLSKASALRGQKSESAELAAARREIDQAQLAWIEHYLSGNQQARLVQLELQWEGLSALVTRPSIASEVRLTDAQRKALLPLVLLRHRHRIQGQPTADDDHALATQVEQTLTASQKELWASLQGLPLNRLPQPAASADAPATATASASSASETTRR
jgi:hypothetical protein